MEVKFENGSTIITLEPTDIANTTRGVSSRRYYSNPLNRPHYEFTAEELNIPDPEKLIDGQIYTIEMESETGEKLEKNFECYFDLDTNKIKLYPVEEDK